MRGYDGIKANAAAVKTSTWYKKGLSDAKAGREWDCRERNNGYAFVDYDAGYKAGKGNTGDLFRLPLSSE